MGSKAGEFRVTAKGSGVCIGVRVSPAARKTELKGLYGDRVKVAVCAPPVGGRANTELEQALASWMGLGRDEVEVISGRTSRDKVVAFRGLTEARLRARMGVLLEGPLATGESGVVGSEGL